MASTAAPRLSRRLVPTTFRQRPATEPLRPNVFKYRERVRIALLYFIG